jgi:hypothetical protein
MSPALAIVLIIIVLLVIAAIVYGVQVSRRKKLQTTFGPEYDRVVADTGSRADGEKELRERERRHAEFELKPLSAESQAQYSVAWEEVQIQFVDNPEQAVGTADDLVTRLIAERGYPTGDYDDQLANLSVDHARTLGHYRDAHAISLRSKSDEASTEDLRQALVHYRALFADLLGTEPVRTEPTNTEPTPTEPASTEPTLTQPAPTEPTPTEPTPTEPAATEPGNRVPAQARPTDTATTSTAPDIDVAEPRPDATSR